MSRFILASGSPRRRELLSNAGYTFEIIPSSADETLPEKIAPDDAVKILATKKCEDVLNNNTDAVVIGCDTVVAIDGEILGKPESESDAFAMLSSLSGNTHSVFTGVCIADKNKKEVFCVETKVKFYPLSDETINSYIKTGEPMDKAGAYGIQGLGAVLVESFNGDYYTVVGLPLAECQRVLAKFGINGKIKL